MIKVAPSILSADFVNLERDIRKLSETGVDYVHVDVMDGIFVPNITIGIPVVAAIRRITDLPLDVHLMIDRPLRYVEQFCKAGSDLLTVHIEADTEENMMTVEPGFGGQSFMEHLMPKLRQLRAYIDAQNPACELEVDGGVNEKTAMICRENGANVLVAGSAYFKAADPAAFVRALKA